jgi:hypothetical protein
MRKITFLIFIWVCISCASKLIAPPGPGKPTVSPTPFFQDKTETYGLGGIQAVRFYAVDYNGDTYTDLVILPDFGAVPDFYTFHPGTNAFAKLPYNPFPVELKAQFLHFNDFNKDGVIDAIVVETSENGRKVRLFRGVRNPPLIRRLFFVEVEKAVPVSGMSISSLAVLDVNADGLLDLFLGTLFSDSEKGKNIVPDRLFLGTGDGLSFKEGTWLLEGELKRTRKNVFLNTRPTMGASTCDLDGNGRPDILTVSLLGFKNKMWLNLFASDQDRFFRDFSVVSGYAEDPNEEREGVPKSLAAGNSVSVSCADYNNDGVMDIYLGTYSDPLDVATRDRPSLLTGNNASNPPSYIRSRYDNANDRDDYVQNDRGAVWVDYNNDGFLDLLVSNGAKAPDGKLVLFRQNEKHDFEDVAGYEALEVPEPSGAITLDVNRDGRMDILAGQMVKPIVEGQEASGNPSRIFLFENIGNVWNRRAIRFFLGGVKSNSHAYGATIRLVTTKGERLEWIDDIRGTSSGQKERGALFAIGKDEKIQSVEVIWPFTQGRGSSGEGYLLKKSYDLGKFEFENFLELSLCENGRVYRGRDRCLRYLNVPGVLKK